MSEFKVNEYITLKLESGITNIYVNGKFFKQCYFEEVADKYGLSSTSVDDERYISPELEFSKHCSNLQVWAQNNYDIHFLHRNIAFPLLKELINVGDPIAKRFIQNYYRVKPEHAKILLGLVKDIGIIPVLNYIDLEKIEDDFLEDRFLGASKGVYIRDNEIKALILFCRIPDEIIDLILIQRFGIKPEQAIVLMELEINYKESANWIIKFPFDSRDIWNCLDFDADGENIVKLRLYDFGRTLPESIGNLESLKELILEQNELETLPESIGNLRYLQKLDLGENRLSTLPESIGNLSSLKELLLDNNRLSTFPESIGNLKSLRKLNLCGNQLTTLPESIGNLKSLRKLDLCWNQLTNLPDSIGNLTSLNVLVLAYNQLTTLPESIGNLISLKELDLSSNQITNFPKSITKLKSLQKLSLEDFHFTTLPQFIENLKSLQELYLRHNQLKTIPESIGNLHLLRVLWLWENQLTTLPESILNLKSLEVLNLGSNEFKTIHEFIIKLTSLQKLDLSKNPLVENQDSATKSVLRLLKEKGVKILPENL